VRDKIREELGVISELGSHWFMARGCSGVCGSMARRYVAIMLSTHVKRLCESIRCGSLDPEIYGSVDALIRIGDELREGGDLDDHLIERVVDEFMSRLPLIERMLVSSSQGRLGD